MMKSLDFRGVWLTPLLALLTAVVAGVLYAGVAFAANVNEQEPNDTRAEAQDIDNAFSLDQDPDIGDCVQNTSTTIPHATVEGTGNNTVDFYKFTVTQAGERGIFDVDYAINEQGEGFDSWIEIYDANGNLLALNDDSFPPDENSPLCGAQGSTSGLDSYLEYTFAEPGTYYIAVGAYPGLQPIPEGTSYELQVSLQHHPVAPDEPQTKEECKNGGWRDFKNPDGTPMFKNQGDCVSFVASQGKNEPNG